MYSYRIHAVLVLFCAILGGCADDSTPQSGGAPPPAAPVPANRAYVIHVVDEATGRGVPLIELKTVSGVRYVTDSAGIVAFDDIALLGERVFFEIQGHGYSFAKDGFGIAGVALDTAAGGRATLKVKRLNIAERLYRITGEGIYRDSEMAGQVPPIRQPRLNGQVSGQDSVLAVVYRGRINWFWGDTLRPAYPLGNFSTSGAVSELPGRGGLDPSIGVNLQYFTDKNGFSRGMCPLKEPGLVWVDAAMVLPDAAGRERLVCRYFRMKSLGEMLEHGLAVYNDGEDKLEKFKQYDLDQRLLCPRGQAFGGRGENAGYMLFATPLANVRMPAKFESAGDFSTWQAFTPLVAGTRFGGTAKVERGPAGNVVWAWKSNTDPIGPVEERQLVSAGQLKPDELRYQPTDVETGKTITLHSGTIHWNDYRKKWIMIALQAGGTSMLGEVYYLESADPTGPWKRARKIVTHDKYSFYNPNHHDFFDQEGGRYIYFEGTYASTFSGNADRTARYDYNQIMYRLDLADTRLRDVARP
jgi:hypothetical protein